MITGIERYYFLFALGILYCIFAVAQDFRRREVANWLSFSLIGFALAYRAFYSSYFSDWNFLLFGILGFAVFLIFGNIFYYSGIFGGGDAKLLMGLGLLLPIENFMEGFYVIFGFFLIFVLVGVIYSLGYSAFLALKNWKKFRGEFGKNLVKRRGLFYVFFLFVLIWIFVYFSFFGFSYILTIGAIFIILLPFLLVYLFSLDKCMIELKKPRELTEGDWLVEHVKLRNYVVRKTAYGLTLKDIQQLKKARRAVLIKGGIPFTPVFFISLIVMALFYAILRLNFQLILVRVFS